MCMTYSVLKGAAGLVITAVGMASLAVIGFAVTVVSGHNRPARRSWDDVSHPDDYPINL